MFFRNVDTIIEALLKIVSNILKHCNVIRLHSLMPRCRNNDSDLLHRFRFLNVSIGESQAMVNLVTVQATLYALFSQSIVQEKYYLKINERVDLRTVRNVQEHILEKIDCLHGNAHPLRFDYVYQS
ncbi:hypothetical protein ABEB36_002616 [Hypothenemus hampei]|uniref:Protein kinase domain-containing protein n=1 Tax=Hypothenemus hampei TaxID=57062 RepID=A0ABD1F6G1_HYPHA